MLIIEKGRSKTAPADTARVKVLRNSLEGRGEPASAEAAQAGQQKAHREQGPALQRLHPNRANTHLVEYTQLEDKRYTYSPRS